MAHLQREPMRLMTIMGKVLERELSDEYPGIRLSNSLCAESGCGNRRALIPTQKNPVFSQTIRRIHNKTNITN